MGNIVARPTNTDGSVELAALVHVHEDWVVREEEVAVKKRFCILHVEFLRRG